jgi:hypothetical protein
MIQGDSDHFTRKERRQYVCMGFDGPQKRKKVLRNRNDKMSLGIVQHAKQPDTGNK